MCQLPRESVSGSCQSAAAAWGSRTVDYGEAVSNPTPPTPQTVLISLHAGEQYRDRVKPALDVAAARAELEQLRLVGEITSVEPAWANAARPAPFYLVVSDSVALPLARHGAGWIATTCVSRSTYTPTRRAQRNAYKASKAARSRAERRARS
jgi:hypothetical protein